MSEKYPNEYIMKYLLRIALILTYVIGVPLIALLFAPLSLIALPIRCIWFVLTGRFCFTESHFDDDMMIARLINLVCDISEYLKEKLKQYD